MGTTNPPDGWEMVVGTWGTDADQDTTTTNTIGESSLQFKSTAVATSMISDYIPVESLFPYDFRAKVQASSVAAGRTVTLDVGEYLADKTLISYFNWYAAAVLPGAATWYDLRNVLNMASNAKWVRMRITKAAVAFTVNFDYVGFARYPRSFAAYPSGATSCANGAFTQIDFQTELYDYGFCFASSTFTAKSAGIWHFDTSVLMANTMGDQKTAVGAFYLNGAESKRFYQDQTAMANAYLAVHGSADIEVARGDTVDVRVYQNSGGAVNTAVASASYTWFNGREIM